MTDNNKNGSNSNSNVIQFEPFKNSKKWDDEYPKFLGNLEKHFGAKTDPESMMQRLYYSLRFLQGNINAFWIFDVLGIQNMKEEELKRGKQFCIDWLQEMLNTLKNS